MKWLWVAAFWMQKCAFSGIISVSPLCESTWQDGTKMLPSFPVQRKYVWADQTTLQLCERSLKDVVCTHLISSGRPYTFALNCMSCALGKVLMHLWADQDHTLKKASHPPLQRKGP
jgi:hypothetical protein